MAGSCAASAPAASATAGGAAAGWGSQSLHYRHVAVTSASPFYLGEVVRRPDAVEGGDGRTVEEPAALDQLVSGELQRARHRVEDHQRKDHRAGCVTVMCRWRNGGVTAV